MVYGLWELSTGNLLATFDSEGDAARVAGEFLTVYGPDFAQNLEITRESPQGEVTTLVCGETLVRLVRSLAVGPRSNPHRH